MIKDWLATGVLTAALTMAMAAGPAKAAVTETDFYIRTTNDLVKLCTVDPTDPSYSAAIHFCHGFASGAYQAEQLHQAGSRAKPLFCIPAGTPPSRNETIAAFVTWAQATPASAGTSPVEGMFEFMMQRYPCAKKR